jgi:hypothetical protein
MLMFNGAEHTWPFGQCLSTCIIVTDIIRYAGATCAIVIGDYTSHSGHAWIRMVDLSVIDPTYGQFVTSFGEPMVTFPNEDEYTQRGVLSPDGEDELRWRTRVGDNEIFASLGTGYKIEWWLREYCAPQSQS